MKSIFQGMNIKTTYSVDTKQITVEENGKSKKIYTAKPELKKETEVVGWENIAEINESVEIEQHNEFCFTNESVYISEDEKVKIEERLTRIDIPAYIYHTSKVLNEEVVGKEEAEKFLQKHIGWFNKTMIESDETMLAYANLHKLNLMNTDVYELFKIVYPDGHNYKIENGKFIVKKKMDTYVATNANCITVDTRVNWRDCLS